MADTYGFTTTNNAEVGLRWYELALCSPAASDFAPVAAKWIISPLKGRMKFCRPVFRLVNKVDNKLAQETFKANRTSFHPIARKLIEKVRYSNETKVPNYKYCVGFGFGLSAADWLKGHVKDGE